MPEQPEIIQRILNLGTLLAKKSHFLFGARATGKSFLVRQQLGGDAFVIDLLRSDVYLRLSSQPEQLEALIPWGDKPRWIVIDEVQRAPELLNEVHRLIEERGARFLLTGSSARKLKRSGVNLLAGRARTARLFPLTCAELGPRFDLDRYLRFGGLPAVSLSDEPEQDLAAYVDTYLKEEIQVEALVRKLPAFSRFLVTAALTNGRLVNYSKVANDASVPFATVREYYKILEDTLVGWMLPAWTRTRKRRAQQTPRFYFFDTGVAHALALTRTLDRNSDLYGIAFEQFIFMELIAYLNYRRRLDPIAFWRSKAGHEVDFVIDEHTAIEVKATRRRTSRDVRGLHAIRDEGPFRRFILVSQDRVDARQDDLHTLHWSTFLRELWADRLI